MQHLPDRARGKAQLMEAQQLARKTFRPQVAPAAHLQDEDFLLWSDLALAQLVGTPALRVQSGFSLVLVATPSLEQSRFADATPATSQGGVLSPLVMLHPA